MSNAAHGDSVTRFLGSPKNQKVQAMADKFSFKLDGAAAGRDPAILAAPLTRLEAAVVQLWCSCGALLQRPSNQPAHHAKISASGSMLRAGEDAHVTASLPTTLDVQLSNLGMKACRTRMQDAGCRMHLAPRSSTLDHYRRPRHLSASAKISGPNASPTLLPQRGPSWAMPPHRDPLRPCSLLSPSFL
jgi:hypothetical protein